MANTTGKGGFRPGKSGNPKGRPSRERALTVILEKAGSKKILRDDKEVPRKQALAEMLWHAATTRHLRVEEPDGWLDHMIDTDEWLTIVQFLYKHIDGPPKTEVDVTTAGEKMPSSVIVIPSNERD